MTRQDIARGLDVAALYDCLGGIVAPRERLALARWVCHAEPASEAAESIRWASEDGPTSLSLEDEDRETVEAILRAALAGSPSLASHWLAPTQALAREWRGRVGRELEVAA